MSADNPNRRAVLAGGAALAAAVIGPATAGEPAALQPVATFPGRQVTGVAVAPDGRVFVNFPRWERDVDVSVAEVLPDGALQPYPDAGWNAWRNTSRLPPEQHFVCVQSVTVAHGALWVLDPAAPGNEFIIPGGPKLVRIDLATNRVTRVYPFDATVAPQGTYLNDIRFSPDGAHGFITDSGQRGALLVIDMRSGAIRRLLDGHPSTQLETSVAVHTDGVPLRRPDGRGPMFAADGITLDRDGTWLYWQALTGRTVYRVPVAALLDAAADPAGRVERVGEGCVADGYWCGRDGTLYISSPEDDSVKSLAADGTLRMVVRDERLRWPDSFAEGPDGAIYVTASHIQDMAQWQGAAGVRETALFRFVPPRPA